MTLHDEGGPATNGTASRSQNHNAHSYYDSAARRRRRDAALRLPPIECGDCGAWYRDPLAHRCTGPRWPQIIECPTHGLVVEVCPWQHCECVGNHDDSTCTALGQLTPRRWCR